MVIYGDITSDITVHHARTTDARIGLTFGTTLMNLYSTSAAQGLLEAFARTTLAIAWTRRPSYCVIPQSGPSKISGTTKHWVDLYCGPITFQIRDQLGLKSTLTLLSRTHKTAVAVFFDGPQHAEDPTDEHNPGPQ